MLRLRHQNWMSRVVATSTLRQGVVRACVLARAREWERACCVCVRARARTRTRACVCVCMRVFAGEGAVLCAYVRTHNHTAPHPITQ